MPYAAKKLVPKRIYPDAGTGTASRMNQRGASLLEVLVSMAILAIGLLGQAALQVTSLQRNQSALQRSQATLLAYDLVDRMRSSRSATLEGRYDNGSEHPDRTGWDDAVARIFGPTARGTVERDEAVVNITVSWDDRRADIRRGTASEEPKDGDSTDPVDLESTDPIVVAVSDFSDTGYGEGDGNGSPDDDAESGAGTFLTRYSYHTEI